MRLPLLALLAKEPAHGYELKGQLERILGDAYPSPNIGQIYLTLQRLEKAGLVRGEDVVQAGRPNKRIYEVTPAGREAVDAWLAEPSDGPRVRDDFFMKLALGPAGRRHRPARSSSTGSAGFTSPRCGRCPGEKPPVTTTGSLACSSKGRCCMCRQTWTGWNGARRS